MEAAAASLGCRFEVHVVDGLEDRAKTNGLGLEAAAREARYTWFAEVLGKGDVLLTGHHADDQRETRLLHLIRGARPDAWRGMDAWTTEWGFTVGRPFLGLSRSALVAVLNEAGLVWREDPSNADSRHLRNRLRHELIPLLDTLRPGWDAGLDRAAELASEWRGSTLDLLKTIPHDALPLSALDAAPSPRHLMSIWSARHGATAGQLDALMELAAPGTETGNDVTRPPMASSGNGMGWWPGGWNPRSKHRWCSIPEANRKENDPRLAGGFDGPWTAPRCGPRSAVRRTWRKSTSSPSRGRSP